MDCNQGLGIVACHICDKKPASNMGLELVKRCHYFPVKLTLWLIMGKSTNIFLCQQCCSEIHRYAVHIYRTQFAPITSAADSCCRLCSTYVGVVRTYLEETTLRRKVLDSIIDGNLDTTIWMCWPCTDILRGIVELHDTAEITASRRKSLDQQTEKPGCLRKTGTDVSTRMKKKVAFSLPKNEFSEQFPEVNQEVVTEHENTIRSGEGESTQNAVSNVSLDSYSEATSSQSSLNETEASDSGFDEEQYSRTRNTSSTSSSEPESLWEHYDRFNEALYYSTEFDGNIFMPWPQRNTADNTPSVGWCHVKINYGYVEQVPRALGPNIEVTYDNKSCESAQLPSASTCIVPNPPSTCTALNISESQTVINSEDEEHSPKVESVEEAQYGQFIESTELDSNLCIPWPIRNIASNSPSLGWCPVQTDYGYVDEASRALWPNVKGTYDNESYEYAQSAQFPSTSTCIMPYQPSTYIEPYHPSTYIEPSQPATYIEPYQPSTYIGPYQPSTYIVPHQPSTYIVPYQPSTYIVPYQQSTYIVPYQPSTYIEPYQASTNTTLDTSDLATVSNSEDDKHTTEVESVQEADKENP